MTQHCTSLHGRRKGSSRDTSITASSRLHAKKGWKWGWNRSSQVAIAYTIYAYIYVNIYVVEEMYMYVNIRYYDSNIAI